MSTAREEIAAAVSTVDGITCPVHYVNPTAIGQATLKRVNFRTDLFGLRAADWQVVISLGQDMAVAEAFAEDKFGPVLAALQGVLSTDNKEHPLHTTTYPDGTTVLALHINGFREE